jgi:hypothetical protein
MIVVLQRWRGELGGKLSECSCQSDASRSFDTLNIDTQYCEIERLFFQFFPVC